MESGYGADPFGPGKYSRQRVVSKRSPDTAVPPPRSPPDTTIKDTETPPEAAPQQLQHTSLISAAIDDYAKNEPLLKDQPQGILPRTQLPSGLFGATGPQILPPTCNVALCAIARRYHPTLADMIKTLKQEVFRKGVEYEAAFTRRCEPCDMDYDTDIEKCEICGEETREPDRKQELGLKAWLERCNENDQSLKFVLELALDDVNTYDDSYLLLIKDYKVSREGVITQQKLKEVVRGMPGRIMLIRDEAFRKRGYMMDDSGDLRGYFACVLHRDQLYLEQKHCAICGRALHPCDAVGLDEHGNPTKGYIEGEIIHWSYYCPSEAYGFSPIMTLWTPLLTLTAMDSEQYFTYANDRPPKLIVTFNTDNPDGMQEQIRKMDEERRINPNYVPMLGVEKKTEGGGAQVLNLTPTMQELENVQQRKDIYTRLWSMYGVMPIFMSDASSGGGLNNEGTQVPVGLRTTETHQQKYHDEVFPPLHKAMGITDYKFIFPEPSEKDKAADVVLKAQNLQQIALIEANGGTVRVIDEDTLDYLIEKMPDFTEMGMVGMGTGAGGGGGGQYGGGGWGRQYGEYGEEDPGDMEFQKSLDIYTKALVDERRFYSDMSIHLNDMLDTLMKEWDTYNTPDEQKAAIDRIVGFAVEKMATGADQEMIDALLKGIVEVGVNPAELGLDLNAIRAITWESPVWKSFANMSEEMSEEVGGIVQRAFMEPSAVDVRSMTRRLSETVGGKRSDLRQIARTETNRVANVGREIAYKHEDPEGEHLYKWSGRIDRYADGRRRTCKAHEKLILDTQREPVTMDVLKGMVRTLGQEQMGPNWIIVDWAIHPNQRGHVVRVVG